MEEEIDGLGDTFAGLEAEAATTSDWNLLADMDLATILDTCDGTDWTSQLEKLEIHRIHGDNHDAQDGFSGSGDPGLDVSSPKLDKSYPSKCRPIFASEENHKK